MKKIKMKLLMLAIGFTTLVSAQETKKDSLVIQELTNVFKEMDVPLEEDATAKAFIKFDSNNRVNYVKVNCDDHTISNFIKTRLIHTKLYSTVFNSDRVYVLPIKLISKTYGSK